MIGEWGLLRQHGFVALVDGATTYNDHRLFNRQMAMWSFAGSHLQRTPQQEQSWQQLYEGQGHELPCCQCFILALFMFI